MKLAKMLFLNNSIDLTESNLKEIAGLIYDTDPYIYPAMFATREDAEALIPLLIKKQDTMFRLSNLYAAFRDDHIVGILLFTDGILDWSADLLRQVAAENAIEIPAHLDLVEKEYVSGYATYTKKNIVSVVNLCVAPERRGKGIGRQLLSEFLEEKKGKTCELCVLKENKRAVNLYCSLGFKIVQQYDGFSVTQDKPQAYLMERISENE